MARRMQAVRSHAGRECADRVESMLAGATVWASWSSVASVDHAALCRVRYWTRLDRCAAGMWVMKRMPISWLTRRAKPYGWLPSATPACSPGDFPRRHVSPSDSPRWSVTMHDGRPAPRASRSPAGPQRSTRRQGRLPPSPRRAQRSGRCWGEPPAARASRTFCR